MPLRNAQTPGLRTSFQTEKRICPEAFPRSVLPFAAKAATLSFSSYTLHRKCGRSHLPFTVENGGVREQEESGLRRQHNSCDHRD